MRLHTGAKRIPQENLHWKFTLGENSLAAARNRTCFSGVPVRRSAKWVKSLPVKQSLRPVCVYTIGRKKIFLEACFSVELRFNANQFVKLRRTNLFVIAFLFSYILSMYWIINQIQSLVTIIWGGSCWAIISKTPVCLRAGSGGTVKNHFSAWGVCGRTSNATIFLQHSDEEERTLPFTPRSAHWPES